MISKKKFLRLSISFLLLSSISCTAFPSSIAPSSSPLEGNIRGTIPAAGSSCQYALFGFIPITSSVDTQEALQDAKDSADVDVLTDVTVDVSVGFYVLYSNQCVRVRGLGVPRHLTNTQ